MSTLGMESPPTGGLFHSPLSAPLMKYNTTLSMLIFILLFACSQHEQEFHFSPEQTQWLQERGLYDKSSKLPEETKKKIASIIDIELLVGSELKSLSDSLSIKFPQAGISYSGPHFSSQKDSTIKF